MFLQWKNYKSDQAPFSEANSIDLFKLAGACQSKSAWVE